MPRLLFASAEGSGRAVRCARRVDSRRAACSNRALRASLCGGAGAAHGGGSANSRNSSSHARPAFKGSLKIRNQPPDADFSRSGGWHWGRGAGTGVILYCEIAAHVADSSQPMVGPRGALGPCSTWPTWSAGPSAGGMSRVREQWGAHTSAPTPLPEPAETRHSGALSSATESMHSRAQRSAAAMVQLAPGAAPNPRPPSRRTSRAHAPAAGVRPRAAAAAAAAPSYR